MMNKIINGDCLDILKIINDSSMQMIYLDPPFFTQDKQKLSAKNGDTYSFKDSWKNIKNYITFLKNRVLECKRVLKDNGTVFLHCDKHAVHYIKIMLDSIFGCENFVNEIVWSYKRWTNNKNGLQNNHQTILFYSKTKDFKFNTSYVNYSPTTNIDQILMKRKKDSRNKSIYDSKLCREKKGVPLGDVWEIPFLNPKAKERVGYPTQKPIILLERIIKLSTNKGDIVLDPFCGSGTACVASKIMGRKYIGIDISRDAVSIAQNRLKNPVKSESQLLQNGIESYITKADKLDILESIEANIIYRNQSADGILNSKFGLIPIKIQNKNEDVDDAINKLKQFANDKNLKHKILFVQNQKNHSFQNIDKSTLIIDLSETNITKNALRGRINDWLCV